MTRSTILPIVFLFAVCIGCSGGDSRYQVEGQVLLEGQPLPSGMINFRPADGAQANSSGCGIEDGYYQLASDYGLLPGKYDVTITAFEKTGRMINHPEHGSVAQTRRVRLAEAGTLSAEVTPEQYTFNFTLTRAGQ